MPLHLKIITPRNIVVDEEVDEVIAPSADGEITVLPKHTHLLTLLKEGIISYKTGGKSDNLAIGGGYLETEGKSVTVLVSRAYHEKELDEAATRKAIEEAEKIIAESKDESERVEASALLRRSLIDMKLITRRRHPR